ncbi:hypothetical protein WCE37_08980 [Luteimonas sp. MJ250]|uniref:hypothetical protein n=1 Tax=Luteimonas TaxID=83614 RepID=UPI0031BA0591
MRIKTQFTAVMAAALLASAAFAVPAQELEVRKGVVTAMQPTDVQAPVVSTSTKRQLGGMLGRALGQAVGGRGGQAYELTLAAGSLGADIASSDAGAAGRGNYLLTVRFDDASESAFTRRGEQLARIRVGSRVKVVGTGDSVTLLAE